MKVGINLAPAEQCIPRVRHSCHDEAEPLQTLRGINLDLPLKYRISEFVYFVNVPFGHPENGTWTDGRLGAVASGQVDVLANALSYNVERAHYFTLTHPIGYENPTFVLPVPKIDQAATAMRIFSVFQPEYWIFSGLSILLLIGAFQIWNWLMASGNGDRQTKTTVWMVLEHYIGQNTFDSGWKPTKSMGLLLIVFAILAFFTLSLYQSYLLTLLVTPMTSKPTVNSVQELLQKVTSGELNLVLEVKGNSYHNQILHSNQTVLVDLRRELFHNAQAANLTFEQNIIKVRKLLLQNDHVLLTDRARARLYAGRFCELTMFKAEGFRNTMTMFAIRKQNSTEFLEAFDEAIRINGDRILSLHERGIRQFSEKRRFCRKTLNYESVGDPLQFISLAGSLLIYGVGLALAVLALITETIRDQNWHSKGDHVPLDSQEKLCEITRL